MKELVIIEINTSSDGSHGVQSQSGRTECWEDGWIVVPSEFVEIVWNCRGYCDLEIVDDVLVGVTPKEIPEQESEPTVEELIDIMLGVTVNE